MNDDNVDDGDCEEGTDDAALTDYCDCAGGASKILRQQVIIVILRLRCRGARFD